MTTVRLQILDMVAEDKITVDEAVRLLKALSESAGKKIHASGFRSSIGGKDLGFLPEYVLPPVPDQIRFDNLLFR